MDIQKHDKLFHDISKEEIEKILVCSKAKKVVYQKDTYIFQQTFTVTGDEVAQDDNINIIPCRVSSEYDYNNYQPTPAEGEEAQRILERVNAPIE